MNKQNEPEQRIYSKGIFTPKEQQQIKDMLVNAGITKNKFEPIIMDLATCCGYLLHRHLPNKDDRKRRWQRLQEQVKELTHTRAMTRTEKRIETERRKKFFDPAKNPQVFEEIQNFPIEPTFLQELREFADHHLNNPGLSRAVTGLETALIRVESFMSASPRFAPGPPKVHFFDEFLIEFVQTLERHGLTNDIPTYSKHNESLFWEMIEILKSACKRADKSLDADPVDATKEKGLMRRGADHSRRLRKLFPDKIK